MERPASISLMYEFSDQCNQRCLFCYNSWKSLNAPPKRGLPAERVKDLLGKVIDESRCGAISLSGGEPLMRDDLVDVISFIKGKGVAVSLITNGTLLTDETIDACISSGVDLFQVSLLSDRRDVHNRLVGADSFDRVIEAILNIKKRKGNVCTFFVGLADNISTFKSTLELNVLLGVSHVALGRFTPGGSGLAGWEQLMPSPEALDEALAAADEMAAKYRLSVSAATPILPCLNDLSRFKHIRFSFCSAGNSEHALFGIDPEGNLKPCSHSPFILGNLREERFADLIGHEFLRRFVETVPLYCRDCPDVSLCKGGCRSSAEVSYGSFEAEDPYLRLWKSKARKPAAPSFPQLGPESM